MKIDESVLVSVCVTSLSVFGAQAYATQIAFQNGETQPHVNWSIVGMFSGADHGTPNTGQILDGHANAMSIVLMTEVIPTYDFVFNWSGLTGNYLDFGGSGNAVRSLNTGSTRSPSTTCTWCLNPPRSDCSWPGSCSSRQSRDPRAAAWSHSCEHQGREERNVPASVDVTS